MRIALVFALLLYPLAGMCQRNPINLRTGVDWMEYCSKDPFNRSGWKATDFMNLSFCNGYLAGFLAAGSYLDLPTELRACFPENVSRGEIQSVITKAIRDRPSLLHEQLPDILIPVISANYVCKK